MSDGGEMSRIAGVEDIVRADRPIPRKGRYGDRYRDRYRGGGGGGGRRRREIGRGEEGIGRVGGNLNGMGTGTLRLRSN